MHLLNSEEISFGPQGATDAIDSGGPKWFAIQTKPRKGYKALCPLSRVAIPRFKPRLMVRAHGLMVLQRNIQREQGGPLDSGSCVPNGDVRVTEADVVLAGRPIGCGPRWFETGSRPG